MKTYLEEKATGLGRWGYQVQPHVVVLAEGDNDLTSRCVAYACDHSTVFYEAASVLEAVDGCGVQVHVCAWTAIPCSCTLLMGIRTEGSLWPVAQI